MFWTMCPAQNWRDVTIFTSEKRERSNPSAGKDKKAALLYLITWPLSIVFSDIFIMLWAYPVQKSSQFSEIDCLLFSKIGQNKSVKNFSRPR